MMVQIKKILCFLCVLVGVVIVSSCSNDDYSKENESSSSIRINDEWYSQDYQWSSSIGSINKEGWFSAQMGRTNECNMMEIYVLEMRVKNHMELLQGEDITGRLLIYDFRRINYIPLGDQDYEIIEGRVIVEKIVDSVMYLRFDKVKLFMQVYGLFPEYSAQCTYTLDGMLKFSTVCL